MRVQLQLTVLCVHYVHGHGAPSLWCKMMKAVKRSQNVVFFKFAGCFVNVWCVIVPLAWRSCHKNLNLFCRVWFVTNQISFVLFCQSGQFVLLSTCYSNRTGGAPGRYPSGKCNYSFRDPDWDIVHRKTSQLPVRIFIWRRFTRFAPGFVSSWHEVQKT